MIRIKRRGKIWWIEAHYNGKREQYSLKTRDKEIAESLRRQLEIEILGGGSLGPRGWSQFREEFTGWVAANVRPSTLRGYSFTLKRFSRYLEDRRIVKLDQVTRAVVSEYCAERIRDVYRQRPDRPGREVTSGGVKFDLRVLKRVFSYAKSCSYLMTNPVDGRGNLNADSGKTLPFSGDDVVRMLDGAKHDRRMTAILMVFLHTGLRLSDVIWLRKDSIVENHFSIVTKKRKKWVQLEIRPDLRAILDQHEEAQSGVQRDSPFLFCTDQGKAMRYMDQELRRLWTRAGIVGAHAHRFRDTFAVRGLQEGWSLYYVAKALGIGVSTAEKHYSPFVPELRSNLDGLVRSLNYTVQRKLPVQ